MATQLRIPTYTKKDGRVMVASMLPFACYTGHVLFGSGYIESAGHFLLITFTLLVIYGPTFFVYGIVALWLRQRMPRERQIPQRLALSILLFLLISVAFLNILLRLFDAFALFGYSYQEEHFWQIFALLGSINILLTFVHECIAYFERYKTTAIETEALKREYTRSRLLGLQSQANPHFLFNNLNTLSSLIPEDQEKAEAYLDELTKVYRYQLRHNESQLVTLETELRFIRSYVYLLQQRHGSGLHLHCEVNEAQRSLQIPPMTLQMIIENCISYNSISKSAPLHITITSLEENWLEISNNTQPRFGFVQDGVDESLDNIINKIHLLCREEVAISGSQNRRLIQIPLIACKEEVVV